MYNELLERLKKKKENFDKMDFSILSNDYKEAIEAIESLIKDREEKEEKVSKRR